MAYLNPLTPGGLILRLWRHIWDTFFIFAFYSTSLTYFKPYSDHVFEISRSYVWNWKNPKLFKNCTNYCFYVLFFKYFCGYIFNTKINLITPIISYVIAISSMFSKVQYVFMESNFSSSNERFRQVHAQPKRTIRPKCC